MTTTSFFAPGGGFCRATIDNPPINLLDLNLILELGRFAAEVAADDDVGDLPV